MASTNAKALSQSSLLADASAFFLKQKEKELTVKRGADSPYTIRDYAYHLDHFLNWCLEKFKLSADKLCMHHVEMDSLQDYIVAMGKDKKAPATLAAHLYTLKSMYKLLARETGGLIEDIAKDIERQSQRYEKSPHLTLEHAQILLNYLIQMPANEPARFRDKILYWTLLKFGLRMSEGLGLGREDLHFGEHLLTITIRGKGNKRRVLPLPIFAEIQSANGIVFEPITQNQLYIQSLQSYLTASSGLIFYENRQVLGQTASNKNSKNRPLFLSSRGTRLSHDMVRLGLERIWIESGLSGYNYTPHSLRHTAVTNWLYSGVDLQTVSELAGHANISTTERIYAHTEAKKLSQGLAHSL